MLMYYDIYPLCAFGYAFGHLNGNDVIFGQLVVLIVLLTYESLSVRHTTRGSGPCRRRRRRRQN